MLNCLTLYNYTMNNKSVIGKLGEDFAVQYLKDKKYKIIDRNFLRPYGEIDIIAIDPDGILIFIEVKALKDYPGRTLNPEDNLTKSKLKKLQKTCLLYAGAHQNILKGEKGWRIDLVSIVIPNVLTNSYESCIINYWENIR